jgi:hypothetical protein
MQRALKGQPMAAVQKRVAIVQSNYIPWKGYFDFINCVDEFILFDDVQYTRRDWRNRNRIMGPSGPQWLTIPVQAKGKYYQAIKDTLVVDGSWRKKHWDTLRCCYSQAPYFREYKDVFEALYLEGVETHLSDVNRRFIEAVMGILGINTKLSWSMDYEVCDGKTERLLYLCQQAEGTEYVSGPAARCYLDEDIFRGAGIAVSWMIYDGYPEYVQRHAPFEHAVTVLDLLFNCGPEAPQHMLSFVN